MKRTMIIIVLAMLLMTGCEIEPDISVSDSESSSISVVEEEISEPEFTVSEKCQSLEERQEEVIDAFRHQSVDDGEAPKSSANTEVIEENVEESDDIRQETTTEVQTELPKEEVQATEEPEEPEPPKKEVETEEVVVFDVDSWIGFAKSYAAERGLGLDNTATDCWDNPIAANPNCKYLERDIKDRIDYYVEVEDYESVWIWYEKNGDNEYLIYIGYA